MERHLLDSLHQWKAKANRKPLIIQGARQVGKTWIMKYFGQQAFEQYAYINIPIEVNAEENLKAKSLKIYSENFQPKRALRLSMADYREQEWLINIPLYALSNIIPGNFAIDSRA